MTHKFAQQRSSSALRSAARPAVVLAAGLALVMSAAGAGQAAGGRAAVRTACGALAGRAAAVPEAAPAPDLEAVGNAAQQISYSLAPELPIGLWSSSAVTLRTPARKGTVRLDVDSHGFSTDSLVVQRYVPATRTWTDLKTGPGGGSAPTHGVFTFPVTTSADARHPQTVALRLQDLDRPGTLTVTATVDDGRGHTYRAPARTSAATRPTTTVTGWPAKGVTLTRGGAARPFTLTVKNTTGRTYPAIAVSYFAYGAGRSHALRPADLILQQYRAGHGWERVPLVANGCDPGMSTPLRPSSRSVAPGATADYRLRVAVSRTAPADVATAESGIAVSNGDQSFSSRELPFAIGAGK
ncbi:hypothetical protein LKL35_10575 [Streptomyces sp. ET3-23]|uniref:hypothetical protein n=1 Tax=Streptomyces sp. ET3-23 TaxID=2885643 RepID=UPI001D11B9FC|nr:hypothetical protein [Streptomyces sp. ET3-23]MCC2275859.1 hypothetical protein [Streptomyces sp. ET3-23]